MTNPKTIDAVIADSWRRHNDDSISTERLIQMVMDDCGCTMSRMIDGLVRVGILEPVWGGS